MAFLDFVGRVDALREACSEMERQTIRAELCGRIAEWQRQLNQFDDPARRMNDLGASSEA